MHISQAKSRVELECAPGFYVRNLTDADVEAIDKELADSELVGPKAILHFKFRKLICDESGNDIDGMDTVEDMRKTVAIGVVKDMVAEAGDVLVVGKQVAARIRAFAQKPS